MRAASSRQPRSWPTLSQRLAEQGAAPRVYPGGTSWTVGAQESPRGT